MSEETEVRTGARVGMWLFISTEVLLFGGLFILYSMYRLKNPVEFHSASLDLSRVFGTLNTCVLITSSLTAALAVLALHKNNARQSCILLFATIGLALTFLVVKGFEWSAKFEHGLFPNAHVLMTKPKGEILFFGLYYAMTGLHAVHVIVGMGVLLFVIMCIVRRKIDADQPVFLENAVLYWHLVDVIWIFLFPLFYLIS